MVFVQYLQGEQTERKMFGNHQQAAVFALSVGLTAIPIIVDNTQFEKLKKELTNGMVLPS